MARKIEYTYAANGNQTAQMRYEWDSFASTWIMDYGTVYTYDASRNLTLNINFHYDISNNGLITDSKREYFYDANGNKILEIYSYWEESLEDWVAGAITESDFDANNNMTLEMSYNWNGSTFTWEGYKNNEYTYDFDGNKTLWIEYEWDKLTSLWVLKYKVTYYYSRIITSVPNIFENQIYVYPNPAKDYIIFDLSNISSSAIIEFFDMQGKKVLQQKLYDNKQITISGLPKGLYMYKLNNGGNIYTGKLIIE